MATCQTVLALGLLLGHAAFGVAEAVLPAKWRATSAMSALIFLAAFYVVLARGEFLGAASKSSPVRIGIWVLAAIFGLSSEASEIWTLHTTASPGNAASFSPNRPLRVQRQRIT